MITRNAIIIFSPGDEQNYLPGAVRDVENFVNYRCSPKGGLWRKDEIIVLEDPSFDEALWHVDHSPADYQDIYFTGHGATQNNKRLIAFKDGLVPDTWLLNDNPRQLIIIDACRNHLPSISGIPEAEDLYSSFDGISQARRLFDQYILNSPFGKMIIHATHDGAIANDISHLGGAFSYTLLNAAAVLSTGIEYAPVYIEQLLPYVTRQLFLQGCEQNPGIVYTEGDLKVPFMLDAPQITKQRSIQPIETSPATPGWLPLLGISLAIYGISQLLNER